MQLPFELAGRLGRFPLCAVTFDPAVDFIVINRGFPPQTLHRGRLLLLEKWRCLPTSLEDVKG